MIAFTPFSPVFLSLGPLQFHYYGLMYVLAFAFAYFFLPYLFRIRGVVMERSVFEDLFFWIIVGALLGGRIFYVIFYNFSYFSDHLLKIFAIWEGGMASHGGFLGAALALYVFCKKKNLSFFQIADVLVITVGMGLMFGRFGNFINGELYGRVTDVAWCMHFDGSDGCRHPSQLYAACKDGLLFLILFSLRKTQWTSGVLAMSFFGLYAIFRFIVEFFREPDIHIGYLSFGLSQGQWISIVLFLVSVIIALYLIRKDSVSGSD